MFEERVAALLMTGELEAFWLAQRGQECSSVALGACLKDEDYLFTTYRGLTDQLAKGIDLYPVLAELYGHEDGYCKGLGGAMHYMDWSRRTLSTGCVGGGIPISVGLAFAQKYNETGAIVGCVFGDGATDQGLFHEGMNCASLWELPIVFLCQNNLYGEATPQALHQKKVNLSERAAAYDMPGIGVDGNDPDASYDVVSDAVDRARSGGGPTFIEAKTYRLLGHFVGDPMTYMPADELAEYKRNDPVPRYRQLLIDEGVLVEEEAITLEKEFGERLEEMVERAKQGSPAAPDIVTQFVYAQGEYF